MQSVSDQRKRDAQNGRLHLFGALPNGKPDRRFKPGASFACLLRWSCESPLQLSADSVAIVPPPTPPMSGKPPDDNLPMAENGLSPPRVRGAPDRVVRGISVTLLLRGKIVESWSAIDQPSMLQFADLNSYLDRVTTQHVGQEDRRRQESGFRQVIQ